MKRFIVDIGNRNMKVGFTDGERLSLYSFQHIFKEQNDVDHSVEEVVEYDGINYCMGKGSYDFEFNKTKKNFLPAIFKAIAMKTNDKDIEIMLACPVEQVAGLRDIFKELLDGKTFKFKYKNNDKEFTVIRVGVLGEGFVSFFALPKEVRKNKNIGIIDIGGRTTNVVTFKKGILDVAKSYNYGALDLKTKILSDIRLEGNDIDLLELEERIELGKIIIDENSQEIFIKKFLNDIKVDKIRLDLFDWYITGGGSLDMEDGIKKLMPEGTIMEEPLFSNVVGMNNFAKAKWGEI